MGVFAYGLFFVAVCYFLFTCKEFYNVFYPTECVLEKETVNRKCFYPGVKPDSLVDVKVVAMDAVNGVRHEQVLLEKLGHKYDESFSQVVNVTLTERLKNNGTLISLIEIIPVQQYSWFLTRNSVRLTHFAPEMTLAMNLIGNGSSNYSVPESKNTTFMEQLSKWLIEPSIFSQDIAWFVKDFYEKLILGLIELRKGIMNIPSDIRTYFANMGKMEEEKELVREPTRIMSHLRHELSISVMTDNFIFDANNVPPLIARALQVKSQKYLPIWIADNLSMRAKKSLPFTGSVGSSIPMTISYNPVGIGKYNLILTIEESIGGMKGLGFNDNDLDDVKSLFTDTNYILLILTVFVAVFHLLFDFLAFKNDIAFWRKKKDMVGLSMTGVVWRFISTFIIMLYLFDQNTSKLVLYPMVISAFIEFWKVTKAFKVRVIWPKSQNKNLLPRLKFGNEVVAEKVTNESDTKALKYLVMLLIPLVIIGALYSLVYVPHRSIYSWVIQSMVNGVYAFGFLFMMPQLFVNYKLKSVAHLPWRAFMYKAFNTFIDDVFAFIITMPTAHRLACFRDDVIFVIYLYQRYLYPVDKSRINEYGQSFADEGLTEDDISLKGDVKPNRALLNRKTKRSKKDE